MLELDKEIIKTSVIDSIGTMLFGLGLYAKFADDAGALYPLLDNQTAVNVMLVVGAVIMIMSAYKVITLSKEKAKLKNKDKLKF